MARDPPAVNAPKRKEWELRSVGKESSKYSNSRYSSSYHSRSSYSPRQEYHYSPTEFESEFSSIIERSSAASEVDSELIEEARRCIMRYREIERQRGMSFGEEELESISDSDTCPSDFFRPDWETRRIHVMPGALSNRNQCRSPADQRRERDNQSRSERGRVVDVECTDNRTILSKCDSIQRRWEKQNNTDGIADNFATIKRTPRCNQWAMNAQVYPQKLSYFTSNACESPVTRKSRYQSTERRDARSDDNGHDHGPMLREFLDDKREFSFAKSDSTKSSAKSQEQGPVKERRQRVIEVQRRGPVEEHPVRKTTTSEKHDDFSESSSSAEGESSDDQSTSNEASSDDGSQEFEDAADQQRDNMVDQDVEERKEEKVNVEIEESKQECKKEKVIIEKLVDQKAEEAKEVTKIQDDASGVAESEKSSSLKSDGETMTIEDGTVNQEVRCSDEFAIDEEVLRELYENDFGAASRPGFWGTFAEFLFEVTTVCSPSKDDKNAAGSPKKIQMPLLSVQDVEDDINGWGSGGATDEDSAKTNKIVRAINFSSKRLDEKNTSIALFDENKLKHEIHKVEVPEDRLDAFEETEEYYDEYFQLRQRVPDAVIVKTVKVDDISVLENDSVADTLDEQSLHAWSLSPRRKRALKARARAVRAAAS